MSRGPFRFLIFCVILLMVTSAGALLLGFNKLEFLFHPDRSTEPFVMLGVAHTEDVGDITGFQSELDVLMQEAEGEVLWSGKVVSVLKGREQDNWSAIVLSLYPNRSAFIKQYTKKSFIPPFGRTLSNQGSSMMLAASPEGKFDNSSEVYFLELFQLNSTNENSQITNTAGTEALLIPGVQNVWIASLNPLSNAEGQNWQHVRMTGFVNRQSLDLWLDSIESKTEASLRQRYYRHYVAMTVQGFHHLD